MMALDPSGGRPGSCNCHYGSAARCSVHTQEDFDAADRVREGNHAADAWQMAMLDLRDRVSTLGIPHKYAARVYFELTMTPNPYAGAAALPTPEPTP